MPGVLNEPLFIAVVCVETRMYLFEDMITGKVGPICGPLDFWIDIMGEAVYKGRCEPSGGQPERRERATFLVCSSGRLSIKEKRSCRNSRM